VVWLDTVHTFNPPDLGLEKQAARWVPQFFVDERKWFVACAAAAASKGLLFILSAANGPFLGLEHERGAG
jgi:hypothetical protein